MVTASWKKQGKLRKLLWWHELSLDINEKKGWKIFFEILSNVGNSREGCECFKIYVSLKTLFDFCCVIQAFTPIWKSIIISSIKEVIEVTQNSWVKIFH